MNPINNNFMRRPSSVMVQISPYHITSIQMHTYDTMLTSVRTQVPDENMRAPMISWLTRMYFPEKGAAHERVVSYHVPVEHAPCVIKRLNIVAPTVVMPSGIYGGGVIEVTDEGESIFIPDDEEEEDRLSEASQVTISHTGKREIQTQLEPEELSLQLKIKWGEAMEHTHHHMWGQSSDESVYEAVIVPTVKRESQFIFPQSLKFNVYAPHMRRFRASVRALIVESGEDKWYQLKEVWYEGARHCGLQDFRMITNDEKFVDVNLVRTLPREIRIRYTIIADKGSTTTMHTKVKWQVVALVPPRCLNRYPLKRAKRKSSNG